MESEKTSGTARGSMVERIYYTAPEAARRLGIKVRTLSQWRYLGTDPEGAVHASSTRVLYPIAAVEALVTARLLPAAGSLVAAQGRMKVAREAAAARRAAGLPPIPKKPTTNSTAQESAGKE
jgi:hypothetical protein